MWAGRGGDVETRTWRHTPCAASRARARPGRATPWSYMNAVIPQLYLPRSRPSALVLIGRGGTAACETLGRGHPQHQHAVSCRLNVGLSSPGSLARWSSALPAFRPHRELDSSLTQTSKRHTFFLTSHLSIKGRPHSQVTRKPTASTEQSSLHQTLFILSSLGLQLQSSLLFAHIIACSLALLKPSCRFAPHGCSQALTVTASPTLETSVHHVLLALSPLRGLRT